jgi:UDP-N-acetylglucosamine--N-acetylmuramyl-(pentapeptide) pyrophosphoryl-undecaprenol N-acetylglucosamine transferase
MDRAEILKGFHLAQGKTTILIMGGSQGSQRINEVALGAIRSLKERLDVQVIHLSGKQGYQNYKDQYDLLGIPFALFEFLDKMEEAYCAADLVISRAGAVTVSEIASFQLPAILIPYPYARGHQRENASVLCGSRLSRIIEDKELSASILAESVLALLAQPLSAEERNEQYKDVCIPDAAQRLAEEAIKLR